MGLSKLSGLYREVILDHGDHPHHKKCVAKRDTCHYVEKIQLVATSSIWPFNWMRMSKSKILDLRVRAVPSVKHRPV